VRSLRDRGLWIWDSRRARFLYFKRSKFRRKSQNSFLNPFGAEVIQVTGSARMGKNPTARDTIEHMSLAFLHATLLFQLDSLY
jgi:hypothetical protein